MNAVLDKMSLHYFYHLHLIHLVIEFHTVQESYEENPTHHLCLITGTEKFNY